MPNDTRLAELVDGIDIILGGHDHHYEVKKVNEYTHAHTHTHTHTRMHTHIRIHTQAYTQCAHMLVMYMNMNKYVPYQILM